MEIIEKKEGIINGIVHDHTIYNNGLSRHYPTLSDLKYLINQIINSNATTQYIRFNPFYINERKDRQIEFDDYMLYLEWRVEFGIDNELKHIEDCVGKSKFEMSDEEYRYGTILSPLCKYNDTATYHTILQRYEEFLDELIPKLQQRAIHIMELTIEDLAFGYFCFEVHSG